MWHYLDTGALIVKLTYHAIQRYWAINDPNTSGSVREISIKNWTILLPPRMEMFLWPNCVHALPAKSELVRKIMGLEVKCDFCSAW